MTRARTVLVRGETFLTIELVAECYEVEVAWVREVYDLGVLGPGIPLEDTIAIQAAMLDRVASALRLCRHHAVELDLLPLLMGV